MALTILAWLMVVVFMYMIMSKRMSPFTALIVVPLVFTLIGSVLGLYPEQAMKLMEGNSIMDQVLVIGQWIKVGITKVAPTGVMLLFAILYFSIMLNAGVFDPVTKKMIQFAKGDPMKIVIATAIVAAAVSLNGDGTTTTLITCTAFVPIYKKLKMKLMNLAVVTVLMNTIMNLLPWGGPTARVISVLPELAGRDNEVLAALAPGMIASVIYMLAVAAYLGMKERKRLGITHLTPADIEEMTASKNEAEAALKRPQFFIINMVMTLALITLLMTGTFPSIALFSVGTVFALLLNYPNLKEQKQVIHNNAGDALAVVILVFGAGVFTGLFEGTGMAVALAESLASVIPSSLGRFWGLVVAVLSAPGTFFLSNDAFYYGVLPVLSKAGLQYGFSAIELGVASLLGQAFHLLSPLVAFIYLLLNLTEQDLGEWQKESAKWALGIFMIFIVVAALTNAVPLFK